MKLAFAFLADAATILEDGQFDVIRGGFDLLNSNGFPATKHAMALIGRIVFDPAEIGETYLLHGEIVGPDGITCPPDMWLSLKPFPHPRDANRKNSITICLNYQGVVFPKPGDYFVKLSVGNEILGEVPVELVQPGGQK